LKRHPKFFEGTGTSPQALLTFHRFADRMPLMGDGEFEGDDLVALAHAVNVGRLQLTVEQKLDLIDKLLGDLPERLDQLIAKPTRVHHKTDGRALTELEKRGAGRHAKSRVVTKCRFYPAERHRSAVVRQSDL
jgi:hypothetical protein